MAQIHITSAQTGFKYRFLKGSKGLKGYMVTYLLSIAIAPVSVSMGSILNVLI